MLNLSTNCDQPLSQVTLPVYIQWAWHSMVLIALWPAHVTNPGPVPSQLLVHFLNCYGTLKRPIDIMFILNPKYSIASATRKNSTIAEIRTDIKQWKNTDLFEKNTTCNYFQLKQLTPKEITSSNLEYPQLCFGKINILEIRGNQQIHPHT